MRGIDEIDDALVRLPYEHRAAIVLHDVEGWTVPEIAAAHGLDLEVAKQRVRRGRRMLVTALDDGRERRRALRSVPLRCADARRLIGDFLDGELPERDRTIVDEHLRKCPTCPPLVAALVGVRDELARSRDPDSVMPPDLVRRLSGLDELDRS